MFFPRALGACACLLALAAPAGARQAVPTVTATEAVNPARTASPVDTFDAAWRVLRDNYVAATASRVDWDGLRAELRPRAERARSDEETRALVREMLARIGQSHFALLPAPIASAFGDTSVDLDEAGSLGLDVRLLDRDLVVTSVEPGGPAERAGVRPGWTLTRVGSRPVAAALATIGQGADHARGFQAWSIATALLRGRSGETATLRFVDGRGVPVDRTIVRQPERGQPVRLGHLPTFFARLDAREIARNGRRFGVIAFNVWMTPISRPFDAAIDRYRSADGLVIDLRGNPGGVLTMIMGIAGHFVGEPLNLGTITTRDSELKLVANPRLVNAAGERVRAYEGPLAILVDSGSYSASEIFSGGMQAIGRARIFGSQTPGGALPAVLERLPSGDVLQYAIGDFVTAAGQRIEGRGVVPDEIVVPTRADLLAGRDPVLDAALAWLSKGRAEQ